MKALYQNNQVCFILLTCFMLIGCEPEVGSEKWCTKMEATPKGDWSANMAADYAKHCIFKMQDETK